ncbi:hypothetical protein K3725_00815 [Leisingera sp. S132]|uniref:hypothetical protein n=1 Tax=Leisingera sp. S132 TaxID=2867016 RepID=UPI0021A6B463|nr:hypothetical protein [Leisingera sp. S132]UWQ79583.1 hypothetical protein K3725_00815 [Leisingera sp. S132]
MTETEVKIHDIFSVDNVLTKAGPPQLNGDYPMLWQLQPFLAWCFTAQNLNLAFALICVLAMLDFPPRWIAGLSALLYVALAFA